MLLGVRVELAEVVGDLVELSVMLDVSEMVREGLATPVALLVPDEDPLSLMLMVSDPEALPLSVIDAEDVPLEVIDAVELVVGVDVGIED